MDINNHCLNATFESIFWDNLRPLTQRTILEMGMDKNFPGNADAGTLSLIYSLVVTNNLTEVLQLGTWVGFSTLVIADALYRVHEKSGHKVILHTVDHDKFVHHKAKSYIKEAKLNPIVKFFDGFSHDRKIIFRLAKKYDLIFIDSSHNYTETNKEIKIYWPKVKKTGYIVLHDAGETARDFDPKKEGGVRRALKEWVAEKPADLEYIFFEQPLWANPCGLFLGKKV